MLSEVGSNFWITPEDLKQDFFSEIDIAQFGCDYSDYAWFSTGRSATSYVLNTIELRNPDVKKVAVLPPFTCHTVIEPFLQRGYEIHTFHVDRNLMSTASDLLDEVEKHQASVILFHRYFGFDTVKDIDTIVPQLKRKGVVVIEDCTQCLYSSFHKSDADYYVSSIRKWCGVPDGGFAICKDGSFANKPSQQDRKLQDAKKAASILKYEYLFERKGDKSIFLTKYREAEDILDSQKTFFTISELSKSIQCNLNIQQLKSKRRKNFEIIANGLADAKNIKVIFSVLNEDEVPLYCPILCEDRQAIQTILVKNSIFAPVVWSKADCCPQVDADTDYIYEHILCIPIDQRYSIDDMERVVSVIKSIKYI